MESRPYSFPTGRLLTLSVCALLSGLSSLCQSVIAQELPIDIRSDGEKRFEGGIATAKDNVVIEYGDTTIYADEVVFNPDTQEAFLSGRVRIYREGFNFTGERAVYNFETRQVLSSDFSGAISPMYFTAETFSTVSANEFVAEGAEFTTHDLYKPDTHFRAGKVRIYPDDRVVFSNVKFYIGNTPVFWFPYVYQSLKEDIGFSFTPGYNSTWGAFLLTQYGFPISDNVSGIARVDLRSDRGPAAGLDLKIRQASDERGGGLLRTYIIQDSGGDINKTGLSREEVDDLRYRVSFQDQAYLAKDFYATFDINYLSDALVLEDFFQNDFRLDPQPDNIIALTNIGGGYALGAFARVQANDFFETTERLPEVYLDVKRQPLFNTPLYYEGENSVSNLKRTFEEDSPFPDYDALRADSFHQILLPTTLFGWLNITPRAGARLTYYSDTGEIQEVIEEGYYKDKEGKKIGLTLNEDGNIVDENGKSVPGSVTSSSVVVPNTIQELSTYGSEFRTVFNLGLEASFKMTKEFEGVANRALGLDGLRHVVQPYTNFSYVSDPSVDPEKVLQFDRLIPSSELTPIDFPQFTSIDSIDQWTVWRWGVHNRWQTKRDGGTINWLTLDSYFDINIENPYDEEADFSNVFNELKWRPLPWASLEIDSQLPILDSGFTEVNSSINFLPTRDLVLDVGHRYLEGNPFFQDSNLITFGAYYRINENWAVSFREQYEFDDAVLEGQSYTLHRDLSSWVAAISAIVRDNRGEEDIGVFMTFTLKDFPKLNLDFPVSVGGNGSEGY